MVAAAGPSEGDVHDGSIIRSQAEGVEYFTICFQEDPARARAVARRAWPAGLASPEPEELINEAILRLSQRAENRASDPDTDPIVRSGAGLLYAQIEFEGRDVVRRLRRERDRHGAPSVEDDDEPISPHDPRVDVASEAVQAADGLDPADPAVAEVRLMLALQVPVRDALAALTPTRRQALARVLFRGDDAPLDTATRKALERARADLHPSVASTLDRLGLRMPADVRLVDVVLLRLLSLGLLHRGELHH